MNIEDGEKKKTPKGYELLLCDLTSNIVGVGAPILAARQTLLSLENATNAFSDGQEFFGLSHLLITSFNMASTGAFIISGVFARRRAKQILNGG